MKAKKRVICTVGVILIVVALSMLLMGCPAKDERKHVVIEVINPMTGEPLKHNDSIELIYDGQPKIIEVKLKTEGKRGKYLTDEDFVNNNLKSHIMMSINSKGVSDWQNAWPIDPGIYEVYLQFNDFPERPNGVMDENYYTAIFDFFIYIYE